MFSLDRRNIRVAVSPFCNLNCIYCDGQRSRKPDKPGAMEDFRKKPLSQGVISTDEFVKIIGALHLAGFDGMTLTGGEPFLNPEWDVIVEKSKEIGMSRVGVTTNGVLLNSYLKKNVHLPKGLTLLTLSLDTVDPKRFNAITGQDKFNEIIKGIKAAKKDNPKLIIRANKVVLRSDMKFLLDYIKFCEKTGAFNEVNLLNLVLKERQSKNFFEKEFISAADILKFFGENTKYKFSIDEKYEYNAESPNGLKIILKDTNLTLRNKQCANCPIYCQEGFYTVRVATDGNITACPDHRAELPSIDGAEELKNGTLSKSADRLVKIFETVKLEKTLDYFFARNNIGKRDSE
jgi:molybdenum cofactor biosynthesis enzyme MoaA